MMSSPSAPPPQYILLSHSTVSPPLVASQFNSPPTLSHPIIQYHFRDDSPLSLDSNNNTHVLVMDYDPASPDSISVQSLSSQLAVTSLKVTDAPGAVNDDEEPKKNNKMYVIETVSYSGAVDKGNVTADEVPAMTSLANFRHRNALLRRALEYPLPSETVRASSKQS